MAELTALPGAHRSGVSRARNTRWADVSDLYDRVPENLFEEIRLKVGSGWVEELVIRGESRTAVLTAVVAAARSCGRIVRLDSSAPLASLPPALAGESWIREEDTESLNWVLLQPQRTRWQLGVKRLIDLVVAATLLSLLLPALLAIAIAIKLTSDGPILYRWRVLGENGRPFVGFKFRTMVRDADALKLDLLHLNERRGPVFKIAQDPRVTPLGRWLRKHSVDELPQLWSVLVGDMSLVGPRPVFPSEYEHFELWQMRKLSVKPGLTCLWQLDGRHTVNFSDSASLDLRYIDTWSLMNDATILFRTPMAVIKGTGH